MRLWIICYDIADDQRRRRVAGWLADCGASRCQESVFEAWFDHRGIRDALEGIAMRIEAGADSVRAYPLRAETKGRRQGCGLALARPPAHWTV